MCKTLRICCLLVKQVISKIIDSTYQERMKYLFKGQKNWIPCRMKAVFTAKVLGWICSPLIYSAYPRAWHWIGLSAKFKITWNGVHLFFGHRKIANWHYNLRDIVTIFRQCDQLFTLSKFDIHDQSPKRPLRGPSDHFWKTNILAWLLI